MNSSTPNPNSPEHSDAIVQYQVDRDDIIRFVSPSWDHFARKNNGGEIFAAAILGRNIWDFVANVETRHIYQTIVAKMRAGQASTRFPFRCDSADRRRFMQMEMKLAADNGIEFVSEILREETRDPVLLLDQTAPRSGKYLTMCSWCKKIQTLGEWLEVEDAIIALNLFESTTMPQVSHSICDPCSTKYDFESE